MPSPAALRNKQPILTALSPYLPSSSSLLEVASGDGTHVSFFASARPDVQFQPSEADPRLVEAISRTLRESGSPNNVKQPVLFDVTSTVVPEELTGRSWDTALAVNLLHISPFKATRGLFQIARRLGVKRLFTYGPFANEGVLEPESNVRFDAILRAQDAEWGVRDVARELVPEAENNGLILEAMLKMPANNKILVWKSVG